MRSEVSVMFEAGRQFSFDLDEVQPMPHDLARAWLDDQFTRLGCEPLRPTGKLLLADRVICVARAAGVKMFTDRAWLAEFARASSAALSKPVVRVDVPAMTVSF